MGRPSGFSPEVRERAVRVVVAQQDAHDSRCSGVTGGYESSERAPGAIILPMQATVRRIGGTPCDE